MSTFDEGQHPRSDSGKFEAKFHHPADIDLSGVIDNEPEGGWGDPADYDYSGGAAQFDSPPTPSDGDYEPKPGKDSFRPDMNQYVDRTTGDVHGNAYNMKAHSWRESLHHRDIVAPKAIGVPGVKGPVMWSDTTTAQKLAYMDGYASALEAAETNQSTVGADWQRERLRDRGVPQDFQGDETLTFIRQDGWRRAVMVEGFRTTVKRNGHMPESDVVIARKDTRQGMVKLTSPEDMGGGLIEATVKEQPTDGVYGESPDKVGRKVLFRADEVYGWT